MRAAEERGAGAEADGSSAAEDVLRDRPVQGQHRQRAPSSRSARPAPASRRSFPSWNSSPSASRETAAAVTSAGLAGTVLPLRHRPCPSQARLPRLASAGEAPGHRGLQGREKDQKLQRDEGL